MRLINTTTFELEEFDDNVIPPYVILSHRWQQDEVLFKDVISGIARSKQGYSKITMTCIMASSKGYQYVWIDTCCIDKSSSAELSESINSMYRWYQEAAECFAYLYDIPSTPFHDSVWFSRGWTLQELIAPHVMSFYDSDWTLIGTKVELCPDLARITGIPEDILSGLRLVQSELVASRFSWAAKRTTTRIEDQAYSLMGLFDVHMPMLYGEGRAAFRRLQEEIIKRFHDTSIFLWYHNIDHGSDDPLPLLAPDLQCFGALKHQYKCISPTDREESVETADFSITNTGMTIQFRLLPWTTDVYFALLDCQAWSNDLKMVRPSIILRWYRPDRFKRIRYMNNSIINLQGFSGLTKERIPCFNLVPSLTPQLTAIDAHEKPATMLSIVVQTRTCKIGAVWGPNHRPTNRHGVFVRLERSPFWGADGIPEPHDIFGWAVRSDRFGCEYTLTCPAGPGLVFGMIESHVDRRAFFARRPDDRVAFIFALDQDFKPVCLCTDSVTIKDRYRRPLQEPNFLLAAEKVVDLGIYKEAQASKHWIGNLGLFLTYELSREYGYLTRLGSLKWHETQGDHYYRYQLEQLTKQHQKERAE